MKKLVKEDLQDLKFDGIIVGVPIIENIKEGQHDDISFIVECNYYTNGKHGYKEPGCGCDNSSFYHVAYNMSCLPNGLWMNATSRFTIEHSFRFDSYNYYKFNDMTEFCKWYLQRLGYTCNRPETTVTQKTYKKISPEQLPGMEMISPDVKPNEPLLWNGEEYIGLKIKRKDRLKEVQQYVQKVMNISDTKRSYEKTNDPRYKEKLEEQQKELLDWLEEEI